MCGRTLHRHKSLAPPPHTSHTPLRDVIQLFSQRLLPVSQAVEIWACRWLLNSILTSLCTEMASNHDKPRFFPARETPPTPRKDATLISLALEEDIWCVFHSALLLMFHAPLKRENEIVKLSQINIYVHTSLCVHIVHLHVYTTLCDAGDFSRRHLAKC